MGEYYDGAQIRFGPRLTPAVKGLLIANAAVFIIQILLGDPEVEKAAEIFIKIFGLYPPYALRGALWQFVTYMFLHGDFWHIALNMLLLWMLGCDVETSWGARSFLYYYFSAGIVAGALNLLATVSTGVPTIGASGALFAIIVAFAMAFPNRILYLNFFFPVKAKHFAIFMFAVQLYMVTLSTDPEAGRIAYLAHLGGALYGYLYLKFGDRVRYLMPRIPRIRFNAGSRKNKNEEDPDTWNSFMENEIDPILDKISREGFGSLTKKERKILKKGRGNNR